MGNSEKNCKCLKQIVFFKTNKNLKRKHNGSTKYVISSRLNATSLVCLLFGGFSVILILIPIFFHIKLS